MRRLRLLGLIALLSAVNMVLMAQPPSCSSDDPTSPGGVVPVTREFDNMSNCNDAPNAQYFYRLEQNVGSGTWTLPGGVTVTLTFYNTPCGQVFDFVSDGPMYIIDVKGGTEENVYNFGMNGVFSDGYLHSPVNDKNGKYFGVSHIDFCYSACIPCVITCPADVTVDCDASTEPAATGEPSLTGDCGTASHSDQISQGNCAGNYTITRTWSVTNLCNNTTVECTQTITVQDTEAPVISIDSEDDPAGACNPTIVPPTFSATDNCGVGIPVVTTDGPESTNGCDYTQTWTANVNDDCGNPATPVSVTYTWTVDTEAPVITGSGNDPNGACNPTIVPPTFSATDNCGVGIPVVTTAGPTNTGCDYTQTWTANVNDDCGNPAAPVSVTYTWVQDTEAPVIAVATSNDPSGACNPGSIVPPTFSATDNCGVGTPIVTTDGPENTGCNYTQTWTANVNDDCGNPATPVSVTYTWVVDTQAPTITCPADVTVECDAVPALGTAIATDNCDNVTVTYNGQTRADGNCDYNYTLSRTWTAVDGCGNSTQCTQTITVVDTEGPVFDAYTPDCYGNGPTATDNCGSVTIDCAEGNVVSLGGGCYEMTITYTATDDCGNPTTLDVTHSWCEGVSPRVGTGGNPRDEAEELLELRSEGTVNHYPVEIPVVASPIPTDGTIMFTFELPYDAEVSIKLYDLYGNVVGNVFEGNLSEGDQTIRYDVRHLPFGTYLYKMNAGQSMTSGKVIRN